VPKGSVTVMVKLIYMSSTLLGCMCETHPPIEFRTSKICSFSRECRFVARFCKTYGALCVAYFALMNQTHWCWFLSLSTPIQSWSWKTH